MVKKFLLGLLFFYAMSSYAWNTLGHMVVAQIAYEKLNPDVKKQVDDMVMTLNKEYPNTHAFYQLGPWMDFLRSQKIETFTRWHYIDKAFSADATPVKNLTDTDNAVWAIEQFKPVIENKKANPYERSRFLAFLVHTVSDIHQPLHTVSRISATFPDGDQGGNLFKIKYPATHPQLIPLHRLWDRGIDLFEGDSTYERVLQISHEITAKYPENYFGARLAEVDVNEWVSEGYQSATSFVYVTEEYQVPSSDYLKTGRQIAEQKAALAGYRLAAMLNQLLGH